MPIVLSYSNLIVYSEIDVEYQGPVLFTVTPSCLSHDAWPRVQFSSVQSLSRVRLFATPWIAARQASLSITNSWSLLKLMPIESVMPSSHLLAVQGTLKSLLQHHSSKASILCCSAFFTVQISHPYMTTGKTIALTRRTFFGKVMSLLFNMLSRLVITFLPRSKHLLISWLQSPSAVILEPKK